MLCQLRIEPGTNQTQKCYHLNWQDGSPRLVGYDAVALFLWNLTNTHSTAQSHVPDDLSDFCSITTPRTVIVSTTPLFSTVQYNGSFCGSRHSNMKLIAHFQSESKWSLIETYEEQMTLTLAARSASAWYLTRLQQPVQSLHFFQRTGFVNRLTDLPQLFLGWSCNKKHTASQLHPHNTLRHIPV